MLTLETVTSGSPPSIDPTRELEPWRDAAGTVCARIFRAADGYLIRWDDASLFFFSPDNSSVRVWPAAGSSTAGIADVFARRIQPLLLQARGSLVLHASAASLDDADVVVFAGRSGAGKSTLASMLRQHGWRQWADDSVVIDMDDAGPRVLALPFQSQPESLTEAPGESGALRAIVLMNREPGASSAGRVESVRDVSALTAVLSHAHVFDPEGGVALVDQYARLIERVPVFRLIYDHDAGGAERLAATAARAFSRKTSVQ